jgi:tRNA(adenine34) deaminase
MSDDLKYMARAMELANCAASVGEVPVGAVVVYDGQIIGEGFNQREAKQNALLHAEMIALEQASQFRSAWRLSGCTLYVTLEPCLMCAGALYQSRVDRVVYATRDPKGGACGSLYSIHEDARLNHRFQIAVGPLTDESKALLQSFFRQRR